MRKHIGDIARSCVKTKARQRLLRVFLAALLAVSLCLAASGCSGDTNGVGDANDATNAADATDPGAEQSAAADGTTDATQADETNNTQEQTTGRPDKSAATDAGAPDSIEISFDYKKQSGHASNQFAVWIEDVYGGYVTTLYATDFTASGGWDLRPTSIPDWVKASGAADGANVDAVSSATPAAGEQKYAWDFTDASGKAYGGDTFTVVVEGTLRWDNQVIYKCKMSKRTGEIIDEDTEFLLRASNEEEKLATDAPETTMLTNFKVTPR